MITRKERSIYIRRVLLVLVLIFAIGLSALVVLSLLNRQKVISKVNNLSVEYNKSLMLELNPEDVDFVIDGPLDDAIKRPLFTSSRKPFAEDEDPETDLDEEKDNPIADVEPLNVSLTSIIIVENTQIAMLVVDKGKTIRLEKGMSYNGWVLDNVFPDSVEFKLGEESQTIQLRKFALPVEDKVYTLGQEETTVKNDDKK